MANKSVARKNSKLNIDKELGLELLREMMDIRHFEETLFDLLSKNLIRGASHLYAGQEAVAVGAICTLQSHDWITSTHRGHGHCYSRGAQQIKNEDERQEHLNAMMAELCGRNAGYCKGRGGSLHIADVRRGNLGATGIVGGNLPVATGAALSAKLRGTNQVVLCFFGEGAVNNGVFHESLNLAGLWKLPVVYICENNLYAMSVPYKSSSPVKDVASRASAYGIPGLKVDGMDVLAVRNKVHQAVVRARKNNGPSLIEAKTYRYYGHSRSDPRNYRTRKEEDAWKEKDPITMLYKFMELKDLITPEEFKEVEHTSSEAVNTARAFALECDYPDPSDLYFGLFAEPLTTEADKKQDKDLRKKIRDGRISRELRYNQAISEAISEEMNRDPSVFIMGEDVGLYGGAYGATTGLLEEFGKERIRDTPISEAIIAGAGVGAAMTGMRPISEIMYIDFTLLASDQIANQGAKNRYMFGGNTTVPLVIRTQGGAGRSIAAQHSQSLEAIWTHFPGIYVVTPSTPYDVKGLLKTAIRDDNPVMFIEHKMLYGTKGYVPIEEYCIPFGVADFKLIGSDVSIITYSRQVLLAIKAAKQLEKEGIHVEVLDLRTLNPLDENAIKATVEKTNRVVVVYEGYRTNGFGAEIIARINELAFDWLDAPIIRVAGADVPIPMAESLESIAIPSTRSIINGVHEVLK